jgi:RNA polymerase sigma-70 factor, ECF subfamily
VYRIAHNRAIAYMSRRRLPVADPDASLEIEDVTPDPERTLSREQQARRLLRAIHRLPVTYAQVVTLTLEGFSYDEIADVLGISESNVGARLTRARTMLRKLMGASDGR